MPIAGIVPPTNPWSRWDLAAAPSLRWVQAFPTVTSPCSISRQGYLVLGEDPMRAVIASILLLLVIVSVAHAECAWVVQA